MYIYIYGYIALPSQSSLDIHTCLFLDTHSQIYMHFQVSPVLISVPVFSWIPICLYGYIALPSLSRLDICTCLFLDTHSRFGVSCTSQSFQSWYPYNTIQLYCLCVEKCAAYFAWIPFHMSGFIALLIVNTHSQPVCMLHFTVH